jgi:hypothetical protein
VIVAKFALNQKGVLISDDPNKRQNEGTGQSGQQSGEKPGQQIGQLDQEIASLLREH